MILSIGVKNNQMKRKYLLCFCLLASLLCSCHNKESVLKLKCNQFMIELGNPIQKDPQYYLDVENEKNKEDILKNAEFSLDENKIKIIKKYQREYEDVGVYLATIRYQNESVSFQIIVQDTISPVILGNDKEHIEVIDYNEIKNIEIVDNLVTVADIAGNQTQKTLYKNTKDHIYLDVPYYNQLDVQSPNGCETTALYMALKYKKKINMDLVTFIKNEPYHVNSYYGFSGDPFQQTEKEDDYYTIFPSPLIKYGSQFSPCYNISQSTLEDIKSYLSQGHPIIIWGTGGFRKPVMRTYYFGKVTKNIHVVLINGYDDQKQIFFVQDPADKSLKEMSYTQFMEVYQSMNFAIRVE